MENTPKLQPFPTELLRVQSGSFRFNHDCWELHLDLFSFDLPNQYEDMEFKDNCRNIETNFRIDFVEVNPEQLQGREISFESPNNAIDGSIYIEHAHHPADLTLFDASHISFSSPTECELRVELSLDFTFEGLGFSEHLEYDASMLSYTLKLTPADNGWSISPADPH